MSDYKEKRRLGMRCVYILAKLKRINPDSNDEAIEFYRAFKGQTLEDAQTMYERIHTEFSKVFPNDDLNAVDRLMKVTHAARAEDR